MADVETMRPDRIVISPGPGRPEDAGITVDLIRGFGSRVPVLGVCLGHQGIGHAFGGNVVRAPMLMHGKVSSVQHDGRGVFSGVSQPFVAGRYHSLIVSDPRPSAGESARGPTTASSWGCVTASGRPWGAVPPESVLTGEGRKIPAQFSGAAVMSAFPALIEKLRHRVDLTVEEAAGAMDAIMDGPAAVADCRLPRALAMKGSAPTRSSGSPGRCARARPS